MAYYNKFKDVEIPLPNIPCTGIMGEFKIEAFKGVEFPRGSGKVFEFAGTRRVLQDWHPNLVVNNGLDVIGSGSGIQAQWCYVGTGTTPPAATDSTMEAYVAAAQTNAYTPSAQGTPPYYGQTEFRYLYSPGFGGGAVNLNEIGVGRTSDHTTGLTARALTVDVGGTPTTISVLADEYLECYYRRRNYPAHLVEATGAPNDGTGTVLIEGVSYGYTVRPIVVTYGGSYSVGTSVGWGTFMNSAQSPTVGYQSNIYAEAEACNSSAALTAVTSGGPTNKMSSYAPSSTGTSGYTTGTYSKELWYQWGISQANEGGIGGLAIKSRLGAYQIVFSAAVPKVYGQVFTYYHSWTWDRKTTWV